MTMPLSPVSNLWPTISQPPYSKYVSHSDDIRMEHKQTDRHSVDLHGSSRRRRQLIRTVVMILTSFVSGSVASYLALRLTFQEDEVLSGNTDARSHFDQGYSIQWSKRLMSEVNADDIAVNLRNYTVRVHISGTQGNNRLRELLKDQLKSCNNVQVKLFTYDVLLSYHNWEQANTVSVKASDGSIIYQTKYHGPPIEDDPRPADHPELTEPYVAYSPNASVQGRLTLVAELEQLEGNVSFSESIVLMKLGKLPVKNMVSIAERHGALGLLLFSDSNEAFDNTSVYSHSGHMIRLPGWATRRASLHLFGDPLTPGFPSRDFMKRIPLTEANLPRIPVQSIGEDDANHLIKLFTGSMDTGMNFIDDQNGSAQLQNNWTVQMDVFNELERREITNVLGVFRGRLEPDRYVIVGCRYDAWAYGGVSPNTGTAVMMELVKALTKLSNKGWSPRRTVIFANWDAGQMGSIGAFEWIEDHEKDLMDRALSYIDLNSAVSGNSTLLVQTSPLLKQLATSSARLTDYKRPKKSTEGPAADKWCSGSTVFDAWMCQRSFQGVSSEVPRFEQVTTDSDAAAFYFFLGIPVIWARFVNQDSSGEPEALTSVYHTSLDTFDYVRQYVDPLFRAHKTMVGFILEMVLQLSSLSRIPLDVHELSTAIEEETKLLCQGARHFKDLFSNLSSAVYNLTQTTAQFRNKFLEISDSNLLMVRQYNDKVMKFSQSFVGTMGLPDRPQFRNILFGPSKDNYNQIRIWPKIQEVLDQTANAATEKDFELLQDEMTKEMSTAIAILRSATYILSDDIFL